ncbi:MAG: TerB family tellurite resistance protein [Phycisphaerae bacterium]|nr:TerB family tellurite resistance protein [Phycisphaerae bacterium]
MSQLGKEDQYFLELEAAQRARMRADLEAKAQSAVEHRSIAQKVGVDDEQLAQRISDLGFDSQTVGVLHLMPLVEVAWADGSLSAKERNAIIEAAEDHGIEPGTPAAILLASLLEQRPSDTVLEEILDVLKDLLLAGNAHPHSVLDACMNVAQASGGFLGLGDKISDQERSTIAKIAAVFGEEAKDHLTKRLG